MLTLAVILLVEIALRLLAAQSIAAALGAPASGLVLLILALCSIMAAHMDVRLGFYSRLAYAVAILWYVGSLYRWLPQIDALGGTPLLMALVWLGFMPCLLLGLPALMPLAGVLRDRLPRV